MPVYEFYCSDCHTIFSFFSRRVDTTTWPSCPLCSRPQLQRKVSSFATLGKTGVGDTGDFPEGLDDSKMETIMESMVREADSLDENNPRQVAEMMRKLHHAAGMPMDERAEEAIRRMEAGESPERVEEEMGDIFGESGPDAEISAGPSRRKRRSAPPAVDTTLYDL